MYARHASYLAAEVQGCSPPTTAPARSFSSPPTRPKLPTDIADESPHRGLGHLTPLARGGGRYTLLSEPDLAALQAARAEGRPTRQLERAIHALYPERAAFFCIILRFSVDCFLSSGASWCPTCASAHPHAKLYMARLEQLPRRFRLPDNSWSKVVRDMKRWWWLNPGEGLRHLFEGPDAHLCAEDPDEVPNDSRPKAVRMATVYHRDEVLAPAINYELQAIKNRAYPLGKPFNELEGDQIIQLEPVGWLSETAHKRCFFRAKGLTDEVLTFRLGEPDTELFADLDWEAMGAGFLRNLRDAAHPPGRTIGTRPPWVGGISAMLPVHTLLPVKRHMDGTPRPARRLDNLYGVRFAGERPVSVHLVHSYIQSVPMVLDDLRYAAVVDVRAPEETLKKELDLARRRMGLPPKGRGRPKKGADALLGPLEASWDSIGLMYGRLAELDRGQELTKRLENQLIRLHKEFSRRRNHLARIAKRLQKPRIFVPS